MAHFLQWSDLHREFGSEDSPVEFPLPKPDLNCRHIDAILIAGDLNAGGRTMQSLVEIQETWGCPVVFICGNHDHWYVDFEEYPNVLKKQADELRARGRDIFVLDRDELVIAGTRILGASLWTDFALLGHTEDMMHGARYVMRDYKKIFDKPDGELLLPQHTAGKHAQDRAWLLEKLDEQFDGPTLVMTHHIPVPEALATLAGKGDAAPAYCSDLRADIFDKKIDVWVSGHSHQARRGLVEGLNGPIAFTANMMGYPDQTTNFEPYRIIDSEQPTLGLEPIDIEEPALAGLPSAEEVRRIKTTPSPFI